MKKHLGFLGIILGTVISVTLYVLVGQFNLFSAWAGVLGFGASLFLYTCFSGKTAKCLAIISAFICNCVALFIGEIIDMSLHIAKELDSPLDFVLSNAHNFIQELAEANQLTEFLIYPTIGSVFILIAAFYTFKENGKTSHSE
ncbi:MULTISPECIES: hypothetical protein [unclassified Granulicatella]|uniref:hypothetical protein n=1 Tax=unclassified Granulicatella TaxID=2630493 RepID=UPI0010744FA7|nr:MULTISPECIES: hypothetical protein [unclassified Granulicatella]MBF0780074.1 hypothetical protein [Granulicatella sp. 19428wC4_WM01]TFU95857.1 hypothetical protein E4T68_03105 [Granulicatella sp. WM01]